MRDYAHNQAIPRLDATEINMLRPLAASTLAHVAIAMSFVLSMTLSLQNNTPRRIPASIINATAVDSSQIRQLQEKKQAALEAERAAAQKREQEKREAAEAKRKAAEEKRQAELKKKQVAERKAAEEAKRVAALKKKEAEEAAKKLAAEKKAVEEAAKKQAAETKRLQEQRAREKAAKEKAQREEAQRKAAQAQLQAELQAAIEAEEAAFAAEEQAVADQSEIASWMNKIGAKLRSVFSYPPNLPPGLSCIIYVRMVPGGEVVQVRIARSSGNAVFDRQAELAVRKASPLPVPQEMRVFEQMREINFTFKPSG